MQIKYSFFSRSRGKDLPLIPCPCLATGMIDDGDGFVARGVGLHLEFLMWTIIGVRVMWIEDTTNE